MRLIGLAVILALSLALAPLIAEAQPAPTIPTIGVFTPSVERTPAVDVFEQSLRELG